MKQESKKILMKTKLDILLEKIDPDEIENLVGKKINDTLSKLHFKSNTLKRDEDWKIFITDLFEKISDSLGPLNTSFGYFTYDFSMALELLEPRLGKGSRIPEMLYLGLNGGVYAVVKTLAEELEKESINILLERRIRHYWSDLSEEEQEVAYKEYYEKYQHILPKNPSVLKRLSRPKDFLEFLREHPFTIKKLRTYGPKE